MFIGKLPCNLIGHIHISSRNTAKLIVKRLTMFTFAIIDAVVLRHRPVFALRLLGNFFSQIFGEELNKLRIAQAQLTITDSLAVYQ
ncbi:hypothetical protein DSECCO2_611950 [anaerobic digester metagenome]